MIRVLIEGQTLRARARRSTGLSPQALSAAFRRSLRQFVRRPRQLVVSSGPLVLLADGLWFRFARARWVLYLMALKPVHANRAIFLDPVVLPGHESVNQWRALFGTIPPRLQARIRAVISDNLRGMTALVTSHGWISQLCHFHLISQLQGNRGTTKFRVRHRPQREALYRLSRRALVLPDGPAFTHVVQQLRRRVRDQGVATRSRAIVRELLRCLDAFRAYQHHPDLRLPTTTGAVEAMARIIRAALYRGRNLRTPHALQLWATAIVRLRPTVLCNGHSSTKFLC